MIKSYILFSLLSACSIKSMSQMSGKESKPVLAFASDTQAPMWVETILLRANNNREATKMVFDDVLKRKPDALFLLGDVVNLGYSNRQWAPMKRYLSNLRDHDIPVHAILGNHEVMGKPKLGEQKFQHEFPDHVRTGYYQVVDSVAVVMLNSNFKNLSAQEDEFQTRWYKETLAKLDADSSVKAIVTCCHHSPFTNSKVVAPSKEVRERFVPVFLASQKSRLFLSGHCHAFEHYRMEGKDFFVIGGGGGLHQPLRTGQGCEDDLCADYKPQFHYLTVTRKDSELEVNSIRLRPDFSGFEKGFETVINLPDTPTSTLAKLSSRPN